MVKYKHIFVLLARMVKYKHIFVLLARMVKYKHIFVLLTRMVKYKHILTTIDNRSLNQLWSVELKITGSFPIRCNFPMLSYDLLLN